MLGLQKVERDNLGACAKELIFDCCYLKWFGELSLFVCLWCLVRFVFNPVVGAVVVVVCLFRRQWQ